MTGPVLDMRWAGVDLSSHTRAGLEKEDTASKQEDGGPAETCRLGSSAWLSGALSSFSEEWTLDGGGQQGQSGQWGHPWSLAIGPSL